MRSVWFIVKKTAETHSHSAAVNLTYRWIVPIPGTTKLKRLQENIGAVDVDLTPDDLREIDEATSQIEVQGDRYPEKLEAMTRR